MTMNAAHAAHTRISKDTAIKMVAASARGQSGVTALVALIKRRSDGPYPGALLRGLPIVLDPTIPDDHAEIDGHLERIC